MPIYEYKCNSCDVVFEIPHSIKEDPVFHCQECESKEPLVRLISKNIAGFIFKGNKTEASNWKEKRWRVKKNADLELKQIERYGSGSRLVPNIGGTEFDSWKDAGKAAKEAGMDSSSFEAKSQESKLVSSDGINIKKWKAAKEKKDLA